MKNTEVKLLLASRFGGGGDGGRPDMAAIAPAQMLPDGEGVEVWALLGLSTGQPHMSTTSPPTTTFWHLMDLKHMKQVVETF